MSPGFEMWREFRRVLVIGLATLFGLLVLLLMLGFYSDYQARKDAAQASAQRRYVMCVQTAKARRQVIRSIWLNAAEAQATANQLKINPSLAHADTTIAGIYIQQASQLNAIQPEAFAFRNSDPLPGVTQGELHGLGRNLPPVSVALGATCHEQSEASPTSFFSLS